MSASAPRNEELASRSIKIWDLSTYDAELAAKLNQVLPFLARSDLEELSIQKKCIEQNLPRQIFTNQSYGEVLSIVENLIVGLMSQRQIVGFHFTRLLDEEIEYFAKNGMKISNRDFLNVRLGRLVSLGHLASDERTALSGSSLYEAGGVGVRNQMFWMSSCPIPPTSGDVTPLLNNWGGEALYMHNDNNAAYEKIRQIGRPTVIEASLPLKLTANVYCAANCVTSLYAKANSLKWDGDFFDFYSTVDLDESHIIQIHDLQSYSSMHTDTAC